MITAFTILVLIAVFVIASAVPEKGARDAWSRRRNRRIGAALLLAGIAGLYVGQWFAVGRAKDALSEDGMDVVVPAPAPSGDGAASDRFLFRYLVFGELGDGSRRLLEHATLVLRPGESGEAETVTDGPVSSATYRIDALTLGPEGLSFQESVQSGNMTTGSGAGRVPATGSVRTQDFGVARSNTGAPTATFPVSVYPSFLLVKTVLLVDPVPLGTVEVPLREIWDSPRGAAIRETLADVGPSAGPVRRQRGFTGVLEALSLFAGLMLLLGGTGCALIAPRAGWGLVVFLLLAPLLLAAADSMALGKMKEGIEDQDGRVRASAMAGAGSSVLHREAGAEVLERIRRDGAAEDRRLAERVLAAVRPGEGRIVRINLER